MSDSSALDHPERPGDDPSVAGTPTPAARRPRRTRGGLGRGLSALIPEQPAAADERPDPVGGDQPRTLPLDAIVPNPYQPRAHLDRHRLEELAASIRT
ncbi:MAG: hypothetical protein M3N47_01750, partial [Chloroflexota bacterium]|nr:hypothetical protein [Chloroflexota bacterium]